MVLIPRYPKRGARDFVVSRAATTADFENVTETEDEIEQLKLRCAVLSELLWWKSLYLRISFVLSMISSSWRRFPVALRLVSAEESVERTHGQRQRRATPQHHRRLWRFDSPERRQGDIAVLFAAIMINMVIQYQDLYPCYLNLPVLILPLLFIFFNLWSRSTRDFPHVAASFSSAAENRARGL